MKTIRIKIHESKETVTITTIAAYGPHSASEEIMAAIEKDPTLLSRLEDWLVKKGLNKEAQVSLLMGAGKYAKLRQKFINEVIKHQ